VLNFFCGALGLLGVAIFGYFLYSVTDLAFQHGMTKHRGLPGCVHAGVLGLTSPMLAAGAAPFVGLRWCWVPPLAQVVLLSLMTGTARFLGSTFLASRRHARSAEPTTRQLGVEKLMAFHDPGTKRRSRQAVEEALKTGDSQILRTSAVTLYKLGLREAVAEALAQPFLDPDRAMREAYIVANVLTELGAEAAGPLLRRLETASTPSACRVGVLYALRTQKDERVVRGVRPSLEDADAAVRVAAVEWVAWTDPAAAREMLLPLLSDPASAVRAACLRAFEHRRDRPSGDELLRLADDPVPAVRRVAIEVLGTLGEPQAAAPAIRALKESDDEHRYWAVLTLGKLRTAEAVDPLLTLLQDSAPDLRPHVARSLGQIGDPRALDGLVRALRSDPLYATRVRAAEALESMGWRPPGPAEQAALALAKGTWEHPFEGDPETLEGFDTALKDGEAAPFALPRLARLAEEKAAQIPDSWLFRLSELDGVRGPMEERRGPDLLDCQPVRKAARTEIARRATTR
jgi:HEAT repeat protein